MQLSRKILHLPRWYPAKDLQNGVFIQKHARAAALQNEVIVLFAEPAGKTAIEQRQTGNLKEVFVRYQAAGSRLLNLIRYVQAVFQGWSRIRQSGFVPDICHVHMLNRPVLLALWLKWRFRIPYVITEHWSGYLTGEYNRKNALQKSFTRFAVRNSAMVITVSEVLKAGMMRCGLHADYRIVPNVADVLPEAWRQPPAADRFRFLIVADLKDKIKNISGAIRAFSEVNKKMPDTELIIIGDGTDRNALQKLVAELFAETQPVPVKFLGEKPNEEVLKIIPSAHALLVSSRTETFSVVTLEAIFSGRPVIATRCGGPEQFINEQNGILIEKDQDAELKDAMLQMINCYTRYPPEKVKSSIANDYSMEKISERLSALYNEVIAATGAKN